MIQRATPPQAPIAVPAAVTVVESAAALLEAGAAAARDIEIRRHLDLRSLERQYRLHAGVSWGVRLNRFRITVILA